MTILIPPRVQDIGFSVKRLLPSRLQQRVGPFIFVDHMGPAHFSAGTKEGDVRQHPHIGLATVTYLFSGAMMHRDSLGEVQRIEPGAINLMTAGNGIVHSERLPEDVRVNNTPVEGIQTWLALPAEVEDCDPSFAHYGADTIPSVNLPTMSVQVLIGKAFGIESPVKTASITTYLDVSLAAGAVYSPDFPQQELAIYVVWGNVSVNDEAVPVCGVNLINLYKSISYIYFSALKWRFCHHFCHHIFKIQQMNVRRTNFQSGLNGSHPSPPSIPV